MAVESPTNCWTNAEAKIATALANSSRFQEIVEAADATIAATKIFGEQVSNPANGHAYTLDELKNMKAYGQVYSADEAPYSRTFAESRIVPSGAAIIWVERLVTEYEQNNEIPLSVERWFKNRIGDLMVQIETYLRETSGLQVRSHVVSNGPGLNDSNKWDANGMWQGIELTLEWGGN